MFDEISVRSLGNSDGDLFQLLIRKFGRRRKGRPRNLIDVGYGISQVLPTLTELFRANGPTTFLLQQPEVHLHPSAQAALGTLFCQIAAAGKQLVVETHSDYLIDRVRMDVRDGTTGLKPEDVSILYFEPGDLAVKIHSIRLDQMGNVLDAPYSYASSSWRRHAGRLDCDWCVPSLTTMSGMKCSVLRILKRRPGNIILIGWTAHAACWW